MTQFAMGDRVVTQYGKVAKVLGVTDDGWVRLWIKPDNPRVAPFVEQQMPDTLRKIEATA